MADTALAMALARAGMAKPAEPIAQPEPRSERPAPPRLTSADVTWLADYTAARLAAKSADGAASQDDDEIDPAKLSMPDLEAEIVARRDIVALVEAQLADDEAIGLPRGPEWRIRARDKVRWTMAEVRQLELVLKQRRSEEHQREKAEWRLNTSAGRQAANAAAFAAAELRRAKKRADHEALQLALAASKKTRDGAFQTAARDLLGEKTYQKIWERARVMVPDAGW